MGMTKNKDMGRKKWRGAGDLVDLNLQMGSKLITFLAFCLCSEYKHFISLFIWFICVSMVVSQYYH